jgi:hypothetical protein
VRRLLVVVLAALLVGAVGTAMAAPKQHVHRPHKHLTIKRHFHPTAKPSPRQVKKIARVERQRWGGPSILGRIWCESGYRWSARNGPYRGLLQIGPWWSYVYPARTPRKVKIVRHNRRRVPVHRVTVWDSGRRTRERIGVVRQRVTSIRRGKLPKGASPYHGWAAIRVGQRAVSGDGPSAAWECGL